MEIATLGPAMMNTAAARKELKVLIGRRDELVSAASKSPQSRLAGIEREIERKGAEIATIEADERRDDLMSQLAKAAGDAAAAVQLIESTRNALNEVCSMYALKLLASERAVIEARQTFVATLCEMIPNFRSWARSNEVGDIETATATILKELETRNIDSRAACYSGWTSGSYACDTHASPLRPLSALRFGSAIQLVCRIAARLRVVAPMVDQDTEPPRAA